MKCKWKLYSVGIMVFTVLTVIGACASTKTPVIIEHNQNVPENQVATMFIGPGYIQVTHFNGERLNKDWYQRSPFNSGMNVRIPAGNHTIRYNYRGGLQEPTFRMVNYEFSVVAGRSYILRSTVGSSWASGIRTAINEISQEREPASDEQLLFIKRAPQSLGFSTVTIINKETDERRWIGHYQRLIDGEFRIIIPKGVEYTITIDHDLEATTESVRDFIASSDPIRFYVFVENVRGGNNKYTVTQE